MAAIFGSLGPYDTSTDWKLYEMAIKQFLLANSIAAPTGTNPDRRKAILLSSIGIRSLGVIRSLCAPDDPDTKTFDQLLELLKKHGKPPTKSIARQKLAEAKQAESESIDDFIVRLRELSIDCHYETAVDRITSRAIHQRRSSRPAETNASRSRRRKYRRATQESTNLRTSGPGRSNVTPNRNSYHVSFSDRGNAFRRPAAYSKCGDIKESVFTSVQSLWWKQSRLGIMLVSRQNL